MKKFIFLLIIVGAGFFAWQHYGPQLRENFGEQSEGTAEKGQDEGSSATKMAATAKKQTKADTSTKKLVKSTAKPAADKTKAPPLSKTEALIAKRYPMPNIKPLIEIVGNWNQVPPKAYPKQVTLKQAVSFQLIVDGQAVGASVAKPGTTVAPLRLNGEMLQVASLANSTMKSALPVDQTDFKDQITARYNSFVERTENLVLSNRAKAKKKLEEYPELAMKFSGVEKGWDKQNDPRFEEVKSSLASGEVKAVQLNEAKQFRWNGSEKINGDKYRGNYDTVSVKFEVKTIFGVFPNEFKCLLQAGKVVGWIDPLTMEEKI